MGRTTAMVGLIPVLGGLLLLGGCTTLESDGYWATSYPVYPRHVQVYERRYRNPDGLLVVYDPGPSLYSVVSSPGLYWHDGYYYRKHRGHWEHSRYHRGPWALYRHHPPRVRVREESRLGNSAPLVIPHRRSDPDRDRFVRRPPEWQRDPGRGLESNREPVARPAIPQRVPPRVLTGPQMIPWIGGADAVGPRAPEGGVTHPRPLSRGAGVSPAPSPGGYPQPVAVGQGPHPIDTAPRRRPPTPAVRSFEQAPGSIGWEPNPGSRRAVDPGATPTRIQPPRIQRRESVGPDAVVWSGRGVGEGSPGSRGSVPPRRQPQERDQEREREREQEEAPSGRRYGPGAAAGPRQGAVGAGRGPRSANLAGSP